MHFFKNQENVKQLKIKARKALEQIPSLKFKGLDVTENGVFFVDIDHTEKCEAMGELGFWSFAVISLGEKKFIEEMIPLIKEKVEKSLEEETTKWAIVKTSFINKYPDENTRHTRRSAAIEYKELYQDLKLTSAY